MHYIYDPLVGLVPAKFILNEIIGALPFSWSFTSDVVYSRLLAKEMHGYCDDRD